jgi:hypothetical protein
MLILLAAAGLSFAGAAGAAFAQAQPGYSDGYGYDVDHVYDDGYGYTGNDQTTGDGSTDGFTCSDAYGSCGWYDGLFYPGFGAFVFDRHHNRHRMTASSGTTSIARRKVSTAGAGSGLAAAAASGGRCLSRKECRRMAASAHAQPSALAAAWSVRGAPNQSLRMASVSS